MFVVLLSGAAPAGGGGYPHPASMVRRENARLNAKLSVRACSFTANGNGHTLASETSFASRCPTFVQTWPASDDRDLLTDRSSRF